MMMNKNRTCLLCHGTHLRVIGKNQDFRDSYILQCLTCGLVASYPLPQEETLAHFYKDNYSQQRQISFNDKKIAWADKRANAQIDFILESRFYASNSPYDCFVNKSILEIGCGYGSLLKFLESYGGTVTGIESDFRILEIAKTRLSPNALLYAEPFNLGMFEPASFDLILTSHVLEHIPKPVQFTSELFRLTKPGGAVFTEVPNSNPARVRKMIRRGFKGSGHLIFFNRKTLSSLIEASGGNVVSLETFGTDMSRVVVPYNKAESWSKKQLQNTEKLVNHLKAKVGLGSKEIAVNDATIAVKAPEGIEGIFIRSLATPKVSIV